MPGPTPSNKPFPELPKSMSWFDIQRFFVGLREWASQFVIDLDPPGPIPSATGTPNNMAVILSWEPAKKAAYYDIHRGTTGDFSQSQFLSRIAASKTKVARYTWQDSEDQTTPTRFYWITPLNERSIAGPRTAMIEVDNFNAAANSTAIGVDASATGDNSIAIGTDATASADSSTAVGHSATVSGDSSIAIGNSSNVSGTNAVGIGTAVSVTDNNGVALGVSATVSSSGGDSGIAIGNTTNVQHSQSIVLGAGAESSAANQLTIGRPGSIPIKIARIGVQSFGQYFNWSQSLVELVTIAASAFTDSSIQIPANAVVYGVSVRVVTVIPTAATFDVGVAGATTRYATGISTAATTTYPGTDDATRAYLTATAIRLTPNAVPGAATGQVRVTIHYYTITPPTS